MGGPQSASLQALPLGSGPASLQALPLESSPPPNAPRLPEHTQLNNDMSLLGHEDQVDDMLHLQPGNADLGFMNDYKTYKRSTKI